MCKSGPFFSLTMMVLLFPFGCSTSPSSSTSGGRQGGGSGEAESSDSSGGSSGSGGKASSSGVVGGVSSTAGSSRSSSGGTPGGTGQGGNSGSSSREGSAGSGGGQSAGGSSTIGGATKSGGSASSGGRSATGGTSGNGGASAGAGRANTAAGGVAGGTSPSSSTDCSITISNSTVSTAIATVGVVEWSTNLSNLASAQIVYSLNNAGSSILNKGGTAPVDLKKPNHRTLLLGLKPSSTYTFHVEAKSSSGAVCTSSDRTLTTGTLSGAPTLTRTATTPSAQAGGFIVTSSGQSGVGGGFGGGGSGSGSAYIIDADGTVVWYAAGPGQCSRAHMDYEGNNMWMLNLNVGNSGGEMRFVSMDGLTSKTNISGLAAAHHDFTVLPGKIAAMVWASTGRDPESNLVEMASDGSGSASTIFKIGSNLYVGGAGAMGGGANSYHCNYIIYHPADDSFTISDRNPNLVVKVKHDGTPLWQIGGTCTGAMAAKCASGTWKVNHGHDFDGKGNMLLFNNGQSGAAHIFDFKLNETTSAISYTTTKDYSSGGSSNVMGDVQYLPNGNLLITYSSTGSILELDSNWKTVQTLKGGVGYATWRETLYGAPSRK